mmetsp:Transcript_20585/g.65966  ORF Transcript_20585/g.65966 Transcript_20585/m.65966 type:complete len:232 (-) Transcript_20585:835-1530(-)
MPSNMRWRSRSAMYSSLFSSVRSTAEPSGLSSSVVPRCSPAPSTVKSSPSASTSWLFRIQRSDLYSSASSNSTSSSVIGWPSRWRNRGSEMWAGTTCWSTSALARKRPAKRNAVKWSSCASALAGLMLYVRLSTWECAKSPKSGLNSCCATQRYHSRVRPPASMPGSLANVTTSLRCRSRAEMDMSRWTESASSEDRCTAKRTTPRCGGTARGASCMRNQWYLAARGSEEM